MNHDIVPHKTPRALARQGLRLPAIIDDAGENAQRKFVEFFVARIRNKNTRAAYGRAVIQFFDRSLCLYDPQDMPWTDQIVIAETIIPWIGEWIVFYELYKITG